MPVSSLPSKYGIGCFSKEAYQWIDQLKEAGQSYWQILPLNPTGYGDSPYQSFSTYAGNPYFISLDALCEKGLLEKCGDLASAMVESRKAGQTITLPTVSTFADGNAVKHPGTTTFEIISKYVDDIVTVSEDEIATAILTLIEKQKLIAEGAGAVSVAAAMFNKLPIKGKKTVYLGVSTGSRVRFLLMGGISSGKRGGLFAPDRL